jgi:pimeloyl-ACP methyl ester carboxylesterase
MTVRIFLHGLESSNQGTKSVYFRERFPDMIIPNFVGSLQERMDKLEEMLSQKSGIRIVGSSFGGLMAVLFAMKHESLVERMVLLAPAINLMEFAPYRKKEISMPVWVYHGRDDRVIPLAQVEPIAEKSFRNLSFNAVDDDHFLHRTFESIEWAVLLG